MVKKYMMMSLLVAAFTPLMVQCKFNSELLLSKVEQGDLGKLKFYLRGENGINADLKESLSTAAKNATEKAFDAISFRGSFSDSASFLGGLSLVGLSLLNYRAISKDSKSGFSYKVKDTHRYGFYVIGLLGLIKGVSFVQRGWNCTNAQKRLKNAQALESYINALPVVEDDIKSEQ
ncbi:hypothetical protein H0X06_01380 [Candidatus Dependentiae bacterium]|nr:hypothetical protein [Candidatus Dependentiae bacterium]